MEKTGNYFVDRNNANNLKLRELLKKLPDFCLDYFIGIESRTTPLTRLNYALDLKIFFEYLTTEIPQFEGKKVTDLNFADLNRITATILERYLSYLNYYKHNGKVYNNNEKAKARKLSAVRSMLKYFFKKEKLESDVSVKIEMPKLHEKEIIRLEIDEVVKLINQAENPDLLTKNQQSFNKHTKVRDVAILTLFLGTGIRISELVGLNIEDIDFSINGFKITRKGGNQVVLYFSEEVRKALIQYIEERNNNKKTPKDEPALFLSLQNKRIGVRAVEKLVKKYSSVVTPLKKITPHKLRSTYGTNLYRETQDIYIVADVLGHKDVNTTKKHYAAITEDARRSVANVVKLRDE